jgi:methenyltetrahydromethanopterin cyclohydrolase
MGSGMSVLYIYHDSKPMYISRNAANEVAFQLKYLSEIANKLLLLTNDMLMFTIKVLYMIHAHSAIPDKMDHMLMSYREALDAMYKQVVERLDYFVKIVESIIEEARQNQNG